MAEDLSVDARHVIPSAELEWRFGPTGGPGGQHANRAHSRAELRFDLAASEVFESGLRRLMLRQTGHRDGVLTVIADESRSQFRNRQLARKAAPPRPAAARGDDPAHSPQTDQAEPVSAAETSR